MTVLFALQITPSVFTLDVEFDRSESTLRQGGLTEDVMMVVHMPARDLKPCRQYVTSQLCSLGFCYDANGICFKTSGWQYVPLLIQQYLNGTSNLENRTEAYNNYYPTIRHTTINSKLRDKRRYY